MPLKGRQAGAAGGLPITLYGVSKDFFRTWNLKFEIAGGFKGVTERSFSPAQCRPRPENSGVHATIIQP